ncbi:MULTISPECIES: DUF2157 domain-containing protein [unclassified Aminobacter]|uniref:DUF2157 domain-containing protein n=1 Tax=unclassified Aminobacter TaxID=2644704 RepID=UPI000465132A|nr:MULTISPECIES: DUF2157 domain-containing protein [unclassified Aminobacter]TWH24408.1 putative membrane protein [Aminobacter sp. J15]
MASYATRVKGDIERWAKAGLIDAATAEKLSFDVSQRHRGVSFGVVLATMAAALFAAAILLIVAANWEMIPRLVRVGLLFALMVFGYVGGAWLKLKGRDTLAESVWVLAATAFGASIALIGQMYHLSGDERQAVLVWGAGTALAAGALCSRYLTAGAALLAIVWLVMELGEGGDEVVRSSLGYLAGAAVLYLLSFWTRSRHARHLLLLSLSLVAALNFLDQENLIAPLILGAFGIALFGFDLLRPEAAQKFTGLGSTAAVHGLFAFLVAGGMVQLLHVDTDGFVLASIVIFAGIIAALLLSGHESRLLRWLAYAAFIVLLGMLYVVMLGSMLGTAGFFILGGIVLSALAWLIGRLERRFGTAEGAKR